MSTEYLFTLEDIQVMPILDVLARLLDPDRLHPPVIRLPASARLRSSALRPALFESVTISKLTLQGPAITTFDKGRLVRLNLSCSSEDLERLAYIPTIPDHTFDLELFFGPSNAMVLRAHELLSTLPWGRTIHTAGTAILHALETGATLEAPLSSRAQGVMKSLPRRTDSGNPSADTLVDCVDLLGAALANQRMADPEVHTERPGAPTGPTKSQITTPPEIAHEIVTMALLHHQEGLIDFGDPAAGRGRFFAELSAQAGSRIRTAQAVEIDELLANSTQALWKRHGLEVISADFMGTALKQDRSLIIANPPYGRSQTLTNSDRRAWQVTIQRETSVLPTQRTDLYAYFLLHAHSWLKSDGISAWLIPSEFKFTHYGKKLRQYLTEAVTTLIVHTYTSPTPIYDDVRASSTVVLFQKRLPSDTHAISFTYGESMLAPDSYHPWTPQFNSNDRWPVSDRPSDVERPDALLIKDLFDTRRGIATGANEFFVRPLENWLQFDPPMQHLLPTLPRSRLISGPIIYPDDEGLPDVEGLRWTLHIDGPPEQLRETAPALYAEIQRGIALYGNRRLIASRRHFAQQEWRAHTPFLLGNMFRRQGPLPFYLNKTRATFLNNFTGLYPKFSLSQAAQIGIDETQVLAMLREIDFAQVWNVGRQYSTGLFKLEPRETLALTLPDRLGIARALRGLTKSETGGRR